MTRTSQVSRKTAETDVTLSLGIDGNDFVVAHQVYRRLGGQEN